MQPLRELISSLADDFVRVQGVVDAANVERLTAYAPIWNLARPSYPELADSLIPSTQSLLKATVDVAFQVMHSSSQEFDIGIAILNLGYSTKFQQSHFGRCTIHVELIRDNSMPRRP
jgi:hypothetical protein